MRSSDIATDTEGAATQDGSGVKRLEDLNTFFGPASTVFLNHFSKSGGRRDVSDADAVTDAFRRQPSWHWPAFLFTVPWLFYRKMYSGGLILIALPPVFDHVLPGGLFLGSGILIAVTAGAFGRSWYVDHALRRIAKAHREFSEPSIRTIYMQRAGGTSIPGAIFGCLTQVVTLAVVVLDILPPERL